MRSMVGSISSELKMQGTEVVIEDVDAGARSSNRNRPNPRRHEFGRFLATI